jgi:hypothetical protein
MKTLTVNEMNELLNADGWKREQTIESVGGLMDREEEYFDEDAGELVRRTIPIDAGCATMTSKRDGVTITYEESYSFDIEDFDGTFDTSTDTQDRVWSLEGATLVDDDGDEIYMDDIQSLLDLNNFDDIDYNSLAKERD